MRQAHVKYTTENLFVMQLHAKKYRLFHAKQAVPEWKQPASLRLHTKIVPCCAVATKYKNEIYTSVLYLLVKTK